MKVEASEQILQSRGEGSTADFLFTLSKSCSMTLVFGVCVSIDENSSLTHYSFCYFSALILLYDVNCHRLQLGAGPPVVARMAMHLAKIKRNLHILFAKDRNGIRGGKNTYSDRTRSEEDEP